MVKIYTRTGDEGDTGLIGGQRVSKNSLRIESYGTVDELNSCLGVVLALSRQFVTQLGVRTKIDAFITRTQDELFNIGSILASPRISEQETASRISQENIDELEKLMDLLESDLPPLKNFILPGGHMASAQFHTARSICRRAERHVVALADKEPLPKIIVIYLNRLSDTLFVLARWVNAKSGIQEPTWRARPQ